MSIRKAFGSAGIVLAVAAAAAFAQGEPPASVFERSTFGLRASFGLNSFTSGYKNVNEFMDIGLGSGFGAGLALNVPFMELGGVGRLSLNPEVNLLSRKLYSYTDRDLDGGVDVTESAVSIPIMLRFLANPVPAFVALGLQLDIPFASNFVFEDNNRRMSLEFDKRAGVDFGLVLGAGYNITDRLSLDLRWTKGLTAVTKHSNDKSSFDQIGLGLAYMIPCSNPKPAPAPEPEPPACDCDALEAQLAEALAKPPVEEAPEEKEDEKLEALSSNTIEVFKDERGTILSMSDILFESGAATLKEELKMNLTEIAGVLKSFLTESYVVIEGHTDNTGNADYNQTLSEQRAAAVLKFLAERGVDESKMKSVGYGLTKPIADNGTVEGRAKNRRVEIVITKEQP